MNSQGRINDADSRLVHNCREAGNQSLLVMLTNSRRCNNRGTSLGERTACVEGWQGMKISRVNEFSQSLEMGMNES